MPLICLKPKFVICDLLKKNRKNRRKKKFFSEHNHEVAKMVAKYRARTDPIFIKKSKKMTAQWKTAKNSDVYFHKSTLMSNVIEQRYVDNLNIINYYLYLCCS